MSITSALKKILHGQIGIPLAGFLRKEDGTQKLDVAVSEMIDLLLSGTNYITGNSGIDASTEAVIGIDYPHHEIHDGNAFIINEAFDLSINNVIDVRITTPNTTKWSNFLLNFDTESEYEWYFYEDVVISNPGIAFTPINLNRNSLTASGMDVDIINNASLALANVDTDVTGATILMHGYSGSGKSEGGSGGLREEFILKQNTIYGFRGIANAAGWIHGNMAWYEHTDKN